MSRYWKQTLFFGVITVLLYHCVLGLVPPRVQCNCSEDSFFDYPKWSEEFGDDLRD